MTRDEGRSTPEDFVLCPVDVGLARAAWAPIRRQLICQYLLYHTYHITLLYPLNARHSGSCGGTPTVTKLTYSPECVEVEFCEVHIQYPAYPRSNRPGSPLQAPPRGPGPGELVTLMDGYAGYWMCAHSAGARSTLDFEEFEKLGHLDATTPNKVASPCQSDCRQREQERRSVGC